LKVVLDTNVLLSGLMCPSSSPGQVVSAWNDARFEVAISPKQLEEVARVLTYPKIRSKLAWDDQHIERFIQQIYLRCDVVDTKGISVAVPDDPDDEPILATLTASKADLLVTGDADLLSLRHQYPIDTPTEFVRRL
jgi:putative PIN family toxin of toxin-antitoxin system